MSHPLVERILSGDVPQTAKQAAARGALPIPREDLIEIWVCLRGDQDEEVRMACRESLASVPEAEWLELLPAHNFRSEVLEFSLSVLGRNPKILEAALRNRQTPAQAVEKVAGHASGLALDSILDNQTRLIQFPGIVAAMLSNPAITVAQVRRIFDIAEQFFRDDARIVSLLEKNFSLKLGAAGGIFRVEVPLKAPEAPPPAAVGQQQADGEALALADLEIAPEPLEDGDVIPQALEENLDLEPEQQETLYQQVLHMNVPKKVELALKGNKEARGILIRDSNKVVQMAVVSSPKITVEEAEQMARLRSLPEEVFRKIAMNRNFMKKYSMVKSLSFNPKVPQGLAMTLVKRLIETDLKFLAKDKGVSEVVRREAKKMLESKAKK